MPDKVEIKSKLSRYSRWTADEVEFILNNSGFLPVEKIAHMVGRTANTTRKKIHAMGLKSKSIGLPPCLMATGFVPTGTVIRKTPRNSIVTFNPNMPGINTITVVSPLGSWFEDGTEPD